MPLTSYAYMVRQTGLSGFKFLSTWGMVTMYKNKEKTMCNCSLHPQWQTCMCTRAVINFNSCLWGTESGEAKANKHTMLRLILFHNLNETAMDIRQNKINFKHVVYYQMT